MNNLSHSTETLLQNGTNAIKHQEEINRLRGENFNIFSILKMEARENDTHSAFLGELLNPKGSHLFNTVFLELFLKQIAYKGNFDVSSAKLALEYHAGSRNDVLKTGGRIDIYLFDNQGHSICIENKIYANDQYAQIERYVNHNKAMNTVYYLTIDGCNASNESKGNLKEEVDYFCISYQKTIIDWLGQCLKEAAEQAIVRESIKQYILLLKKITNQLSDSKMEKDVEELITRHYQSAKLIEANVWKVELNAAHALLIAIKTELEKELLREWTIRVDDNLSVAWTGLSITHTTWNGISIKLEGDPKVPWARSYYGVVAPDKEYDRALILNQLANVNALRDSFSSSRAWPYYKTIMSLQSNDDRIKLFIDSDRNLLIKTVSDKLLALAKECEMFLADIPRL